MDRKFFTFSLIAVTTVALAGVGIWWQKKSEMPIDLTQRSVPKVTASPLITFTPTQPPTSTPEVLVSASPHKQDSIQASEPTLTPEPTPPPLDESDEYIKAHLASTTNGKELLSLLTQEEIVRKIVRAVYGLSEGRIVREYRPVVSPTGQFNVNKIGQQTENSQQELYRINRDNYTRYTSYISIFSAMNNDALTVFYRFYLPIFENAYQELGIGQGTFHATLISAIDVILQTPTTDDAMLLIQPSVMFKFNNTELEKLSSAHKLMLRMGPENSEVLKLELQEFKNRLVRL